MILNTWVYFSPDMEKTLNGLLFGDLGSGLYAGLDSLSLRTVEMLRNFQERELELMPPGLWNCYVRGEDYHAFTQVRKEMEDLENWYYPDCWIAGMWNVATGDPMGGLGAPWFTYPGDLLTHMPGGILDDIVLMAGQAKRKFV